MLVEHYDSTLETPTQLRGVSVVIPCFNEAGGIEQLFDRLSQVSQSFAERFELEFVFVDDGSSDSTWHELNTLARRPPQATLVQHDRNQGIAAAIRTGIMHARYETVVSMDADCTYDPMQIDSLVESLTDGIAMVTASPYHPLGEVVGVPNWRLGLSRIASWSYRVLIGQSLHTYTSCFRAYRRSAMIGLPLTEPGFVGVAEMLWQASRHGGTILEQPSRLTSRRLGFSKMRTVPVILGHIRLMNRILWSGKPAPRTSTVSALADNQQTELDRIEA